MSEPVNEDFIIAELRKLLDDRIFSLIYVKEKLSPETRGQYVECTASAIAFATAQQLVSLSIEGLKEALSAYRLETSPSEYDRFLKMIVLDFLSRVFDGATWNLVASPISPDKLPSLGGFPKILEMGSGDLLNQYALYTQMLSHVRKKIEAKEEAEKANRNRIDRN